MSRISHEIKWLTGLILILAAWSSFSQEAPADPTQNKKDQPTPGRYQSMTIYGKPAVLDTATGMVIIINPDLTITKINMKTGQKTEAVSPETSKKAEEKKVAQATKPPTAVTADLRLKSELAIAEYGVNIGRTCITRMDEKGIVADIELSNNGKRRILAIELTFRGIESRGNMQFQRLYLTIATDGKRLIPDPGEVKSSKVPLVDMTTSDIEMEITYILLGEEKS